MDALAFLAYMGWPAIICLVVGLGLVIFEMFTPGFAAPGLIGITLLILSVILAAEDLFQALVMTLIILVILMGCFLLALRSATKGILSRSPLVQRRESRTEDGYISVQDMSYFVGHVGVAQTILRPAGVADFAGVKLDVVTEGEFIDAGTKIQVTKVEGPRVVVCRASEQTA